MQHLLAITANTVCLACADFSSCGLEGDCLVNAERTIFQQVKEGWYMQQLEAIASISTTIQLLSQAQAPTLSLHFERLSQSLAVRPLSPTPFVSTSMDFNGCHDLAFKQEMKDAQFPSHLAALLAPALHEMSHLFRAGYSALNWRSLNVDGYLHRQEEVIA